MAGERTSGRPVTGAQRHLLLVEDQGYVANSIMTALGEDGEDQYPRSTHVPRGRFKWAQTARVAAAFLREQAARAEGWLPDLALVDYHFADHDGATDPFTGLTVLDALARWAPAAEAVIFSGYGTLHGRALFQAAAHHWFGVRRSLHKGGTPRDIAHLLAGRDSLPKALERRLNHNARLIDSFFSNPGHVPLLQAWAATRGNDQALQRMLHLSRSTVTRYKRELAAAAAAFEAAFDVGLTRSETSDAPRNDAVRPLSKDVLGDFLANNRGFFADPVLPEIVRTWGPGRRW